MENTKWRVVLRRASANELILYDTIVNDFTKGWGGDIAALTGYNQMRNETFGSRIIGMVTVTVKPEGGEAQSFILDQENVRVYELKEALPL